MRMDINFFSPYQGQKKEELNKNIYMYSLVGFLVVLIVGTLLWNNVNLVIVKKQIANYEAKLNEPNIQDKIKESEEINKKLDILNKYNSSLINISSGVNSRDVVTTNILNMVSATLPTEVSFNSVNITNTDITIQAVSTNRIAIAEIQYNLKALPNVEEVYIGAISGDDKYTFDIKCTLKDVE